MKKISLILVVLFLVCVAAAFCAAAKAKTLPIPDYFPLKVGYWWKYKTVEKGYEFTIKIAAIEKIKDIDCYKIETWTKMGDKDNLSFVEYYSKDKDFVLVHKLVYPASNMSVEYESARKYLMNPSKSGDKWDWKGKGMMDIDIEEIYAVEKTDVVKVPAFPKGINTIYVGVAVNQGGTQVKKIYWYADGIGLVKSFTDSGSVQSTAELIQYNLKETK